jgi:hypothetical protein
MGIKAVTVFILLSSFVENIKAQDYSNPPLNDEVIIESNQEILLPYRQRRSKLGATFAINYEPYAPDDYKSLILNKYFDEFSESSSIPLMGVEVGIKYNFALGSVAGVFGYSKGSFSNEGQNLNLIDVSMLKADLNFTIDNVLSEPWIAPYIQGGVHQIQWDEESISGTAIQNESFVTTPNFHFKAGVLFQLNWMENWIDATTSSEGLRSSGLQNTFIDVFYSYYNQPTEAADVAGVEGEADVSWSGLGAGLKMEF